MITSSNIALALTWVDPEFKLRGTDVLNVGREIWRVTEGSRYELWSAFAEMRGIPQQLREPKWRSFAVECLDSPDVIEDLAVEGGWDGHAVSAHEEEVPETLWESMAMSLPDWQLEHVMSLPSVPFGISSLDDVTGGIRSGTYTTVAGEPGCGKTALALSVAYRAMAQGEFCPVIYSLEIPAIEVIDRLLSVHTNAVGLDPVWWATVGDDLSRLAGGRWGMDERRLRDASVRLSQEHPDNAALVAFADFQRRYFGRYAIVDQPRGVDALCAEVDQLVREGIRPFPVIDYLRLLEPPEDKRGSSEYEQTSATSKALMACAKRNRIPMLVLSEIRKITANERGEPRLDWLKGTSQVGYDAGCVVLLTRDQERDQTGSVERHVVASVLKNRHGRSHEDARIVFNGGRNMFRSDMD